MHLQAFFHTAPPAERADVWVPVAAVTASLSDPHIVMDGVVTPQTVVTVAGGTQLHVHLATLGPEGDEPEARMTADEARQLAAALCAAADLLDGPR